MDGLKKKSRSIYCESFFNPYLDSKINWTKDIIQNRQLYHIDLDTS